MHGPIKLRLAENNLSIQDLSLRFCVILFDNCHFFSPHNSTDICDFLELLAHNESAMHLLCLSVRPVKMALTFQFKFVFLEPNLELSDEILS